MLQKIQQYSRLADQHQPIAVGVGQRLQEHAVDDAEDRGVRADPEPEGQDREQREAAVLEERAHAEAQIVQQLVDHRTGVLLLLVDRSKHDTTAHLGFLGDTAGGAPNVRRLWESIVRFRTLPVHRAIGAVARRPAGMIAS